MAAAHVRPLLYAATSGYRDAPPIADSRSVSGSWDTVVNPPVGRSREQIMAITDAKAIARSGITSVLFDPEIPTSYPTAIIPKMVMATRVSQIPLGIRICSPTATLEA